MTKENQNNEFNAFIEALLTAVEMADLEIPQVEINEEPNITDQSYDDDLLDERYDGNRESWFKFTFYQALEELKFQHENEQENSIWYMTNGERALTFKDDRLVDVRLADYVDNLVYFSAPIQLNDLNDEWEVHSIIDEEVQKLNSIIDLIKTLKDKQLANVLLDIIEDFTQY